VNSVLPSSAAFDLRALLREDDFQIEELGSLMDEIAAKEGWADPAMDVYDALVPSPEQWCSGAPSRSV
jgi:hypothetical protein